MRITFVTQWYPPEHGVTVPRTMAQELSSRGHQVDVLTGFPNYPEGKLHPGYPLRAYRRDQDGRVTVHRAPLFPNHSARAALRMTNYLSFAAGASAVSLAKLRAPDVWLTYSSPATAAFPAMLPRRSRRPHAMVIQDLWPDSVLGSEMASGRLGRAIRRPVSALSQATYKSADGIGVISPGMRDVLVARGIDARKVHYTPNWVHDPAPPVAAPERALRDRLGLPSEGVLFLYAGNLGDMQEIPGLIRSFDAVEGAHLVLMGQGTQRDAVANLAGRRPNVHLRPPVDATEVPAYQAAADVLVVSLQDTPLLRVTMPSKLQASLAAGRPVLVHGAGDVAQVVTDARCGAVGRPGTTEVAEAARSLVLAGGEERVSMGIRARDWYEGTYSAEAGGRRLEQLLLNTLEGHRHR